MKKEHPNVTKLIAIGSLALASLNVSSYAQAASSTDATTGNQPTTSRSSSEDAKDAAQQLNKAVNVVAQMNRDPKMKAQLQQAQGVFIVPDYARAALGVGGRGGAGVLMVKQNGKWSDPAFYTLGGISLGLQAGVEAGEIAMILNSQKAVDSFKQENNWSLNADAGLTIVNWSPKAQGSVGKGDVVVWANTKGLFGDAAISVSDIHYDQAETGAFYGKQVALQDILSGSAQAPARRVAAIKRALPGGSAGSGGMTSSGSSNGAAAQGSASDSMGTSGMKRSPSDSSGMGSSNK